MRPQAEQIDISKTMWHLQNNVLPKLSRKTINVILNEIAEYNAGKKELHSFADTIEGEEHLTLRELFEELRIEIPKDELIEVTHMSQKEFEQFYLTNKPNQK